MDIRLHSRDRFRVVADHKGNNFVNIGTSGCDEITIDMYKNFHYIEIRIKKDMLRTFLFKRKSDIAEYDFGYWSDGEVVYMLNKVTFDHGA